MEGKFAEELYAESLELSKLELTSTSAVDEKDKLNGKVNCELIDLECMHLSLLFFSLLLY